MIIWLASYPKSGNTWVRLFLNSLLNNNENLDINDIKIRSVSTKIPF
jgi:aryl sulfotransferase